MSLRAWITVEPIPHDLRPGLPVCCERDGLTGWTVQGAGESVLVYAQAEEGGHVHSLDSGEWEIRVAEDGHLIDPGWDFLRWLVARRLPLDRPVVQACMKRLEPSLEEVHQAAQELLRAGYIGGITVRYRESAG